jgi:hypothetical protein
VSANTDAGPLRHEDEDSLLTPEEMEDVIDYQLRVIMGMR